MRKGISQRAYARKRGVAPSAVQKAIRTGRITTLADGTIDPKRADREWAANTDETKPRNTVSGDPKHRRTPGEPPAPAGSKAGDKVASGYTAARAMREGYLAGLAKLEYEERMGSLVRADAVRLEAFATARKVRDAVLAVPGIVADTLAGITDPAEINRRLTAELTLALEGLSDVGRGG